MNIDYLKSLIKNKSADKIKELIWESDKHKLPEDFILETFQDEFLKENVIYSEEPELIVDLFKKLNKKVNFKIYKLLKNEIANVFKEGNPDFVSWLICEDLLGLFNNDERSQLLTSLNYEPILNMEIGDCITLLDFLIDLGDEHAKEILRTYILKKFKELQLVEEAINWLIYRNRMNILSRTDLKSLTLKRLTITIAGSCCGNLEVPYEIGYITSLEELCVSSESDLQILPESIGNLINLKKLDLSHNSELKGLPKSITNLKNLKSLSLNFQTLNYFPKIVCELTQLEELQLHFCLRLKTLPECLKKLENLKTLVIYSLSHFKLPFWIKNLPNLEKLDLVTF